MTKWETNDSFRSEETGSYEQASFSFAHNGGVENAVSGRIAKLLELQDIVGNCGFQTVTAISAVAKFHYK